MKEWGGDVFCLINNSEYKKRKREKKSDKEEERIIIKCRKRAFIVSICMASSHATRHFQLENGNRNVGRKILTIYKIFES